MEKHSLNIIGIFSQIHILNWVTKTKTDTLFSKTSVEKIGYVHSEFKFALDVLKDIHQTRYFIYQLGWTIARFLIEN